MTLDKKLKILIGFAGYTIWGAMAWIDPSLRPDFLHLNEAMVFGTIGLVLRDMPSNKE